VHDDKQEKLPMVERNDWLRDIERLKMPSTRVGIAFYLAWKGNQDGSSITVGEKRVARIFGIDVSTARRHIDALRKDGLLYRESRGSGRGGTGTIASSHYLSHPRDLTKLPWALDVDTLPSEQPLTALPDTQYTVHLGAVKPVDNTEHRAPEHGDAPVGNQEHRAPERAEAAETPVDNSEHRAPMHAVSEGTPRTDDENTAHQSQEHRALTTRTPRIGARLPNYYQPSTNPKTNCSLVSRVRHVPRTIKNEAPRNPAPNPDYPSARDTLLLLPDLGAMVMALASNELAAEGHDDPAYEALVIRAAEIATRPGPERMSA
jgi:hypothetical protein